MSIEQVDNAIRNLQLEDKTIQTVGNCRYSVEKMVETAKKADTIQPNTIIQILVWPFASISEYTHYALRVSDDKGKQMTYNPVRTAGFPLFFGETKEAPGLLREMKTTQEIL
jgi:hypothetical protein